MKATVRGVCLLVLASVATLGALSGAGCKTDEDDSENAASRATTTSRGQACEYADLVWNNIYGSRLPLSVSALPPMKGELNTAFQVFKDPALAIKTFLPEQNARDGEEIPRGSDGKPLRPKSIHATGSVARIRLVPDSGAEHPYTGIFRLGAPCGLLRVSLAIKPSKEGVTPGAALKFYVDKRLPNAVSQQQSVNIHVMNRLDPTPGYNVLAEPFSNVLPPPIAPELIAGGQYFKAGLTALHAVDTFAGHLTVDHLAETTASGQFVRDARAPYRITLVPSKEAARLMASATFDTDFRVELARLGAGTKLYDLYADETPTYHAHPYGAHVGTIVLETSFVASRYGDEILHFMHHTARK